MLTSHKLAVSVAIISCIFCLGAAKTKQTVESDRTTLLKSEIENGRDEEAKERTADNSGKGDVVTKKLKFPPCALPKTGSFFCYGLCLLFLNDRGVCLPGNLCACSIKADKSAVWMLDLLG